MTAEMDDQERWTRAVTAVAAEYAALPAPVAAQVCAKTAEIRDVKAVLCRLAGEVGAAGICAACGGECCFRGKYHFTAVDLLSFLTAGMPLFQPEFGGDSCPYGSGDGCRMAAAFRPFNCVTYNCEQVEGLWEPGQVAAFYRQERRLRELYAELEELFNNRFMHGLLLNHATDVQAHGRKILRFLEG